MIRISLPSCSKGSWGLSVLPRVEGIFTPNTISLSPWPRQRRCCYAIRAGRNLPDKEFRYLRTVIVTAAVYWGFDQELLFRLQHQLTFQHRAGITPYTSSYDLAECCVFSKQSQLPILCDLPTLPTRSRTRQQAHLLPKLRCQFAEFLSQGSLTRLGILYLST